MKICWCIYSPLYRPRKEKQGRLVFYWWKKHLEAGICTAAHTGVFSVPCMALDWRLHTLLTFHTDLSVTMFVPAVCVCVCVGFFPFNFLASLFNVGSRGGELMESTSATSGRRQDTPLDDSPARRRALIEHFSVAVLWWCTGTSTPLSFCPGWVFVCVYSWYMLRTRIPTSSAKWGHFGWAVWWFSFRLRSG